MELPTWNVYCDHTTGVNALCFNLGRLTVWFSYKTPVAFQVRGREPIVCINYWGPTTGKHLNAIDNGDTKRRMMMEGFNKALNEALEGEPCQAKCPVRLP